MYIGEVPLPQLSNGEVLIKVEAAALNRADILQRKGLYPPPAGASELLGLEVAGTVVDASADVKNWEGFGLWLCYQEEVTQSMLRCMSV